MEILYLIVALQMGVRDSCRLKVFKPQLVYESREGIQLLLGWLWVGRRADKTVISLGAPDIIRVWQIDEVEPRCHQLQCIPPCS